MAKEPLERNKGQQIDLGYAGHVCQPENKTQTIWPTLVSVTALKGNTFSLHDSGQPSIGKMSSCVVFPLPNRSWGMMEYLVTPCLEPS